VTLNWSTFALELINFVVLVWILQHFLYKPVRAVIERRRESVRQTLEQAESRAREAESMETRYRRRLDEWEEERARARRELEQEIAAEREARLQALNADLEREREKARVVNERRLEETRAQTEQALAQQATRFLSRLLARVAGPELEAQLITMVLEDIPNLGPEARERLSAANGNVRVTSAYPLSEETRQALRRALAEATGDQQRQWRFREDAELMAGIRMDGGGWALEGNLRDELRFFAEAAHDHE
jgi:F-type H+-transporting ATPase subunit b